MTDQQILEKAIQKAIDGGWKNKYYSIPYKLKLYKRYDTVRVEYKKGAENPNKWLWYDSDVNSIIFNHNFAKALWGEELRTDDFGRLPSYKLHLLEMVIAEDPIKYLGKNLPRD